MTAPVEPTVIAVLPGQGWLEVRDTVNEETGDTTRQKIPLVGWLVYSDGTVRALSGRPNGNARPLDPDVSRVVPEGEEWPKPRLIPRRRVFGGK